MNPKYALFIATAAGTLCLSNVAAAAPSIANSGIGCDDGQCIWAQGTEFESGAGCHIDFYDTNWNYVNTQWDTSCASDGVSAVIPKSVRAYRGAVYFTVVDNQTNEWADARYLSIHVPMHGGY